MSDAPGSRSWSEADLSGMSDGDFAALTAKVRAPDTAEQFREIAGSIVPTDQLDSLMGWVNPAAFATDGKIDETKVRQHLGNLLGAQESRQWGQSSGQPAGKNVGDDGRSALEKRHGVKNSS
jgi:hypothetical protein